MGEDNQGPHALLLEFLGEFTLGVGGTGRGGREDNQGPWSGDQVVRTPIPYSSRKTIDFRTPTPTPNPNLPLPLTYP